MIKKPYHPLLGSSVDSYKLSLTLKGAVGFLVVVLGLFQIDIPQTDIDVLVESLLAVITAGMALYGIYRKIITWYKGRGGRIDAY